MSDVIDRIEPRTYDATMTYRFEGALYRLTLSWRDDPIRARFRVETGGFRADGELEVQPGGSVFAHWPPGADPAMLESVEAILAQAFAGAGATFLGTVLDSGASTN